MPSLIGVWKLTKARAFGEDGVELGLPLGSNPMGLVLFETERMLGVIGDGRTAMASDPAQRAFFSYAGSYVFDGDTLITRVDGASSPDGFADQVRRVVFQTPDQILVFPLSPVLGRSSGLQLTWERVG